VHLAHIGELAGRKSDKADVVGDVAEMEGIELEQADRLPGAVGPLPGRRRRIGEEIDLLRVRVADVLPRTTITGDAGVAERALARTAVLD